MDGVKKNFGKLEKTRLDLFFLTIVLPWLHFDPPLVLGCYYHGSLIVNLVRKEYLHIHPTIVMLHSISANQCSLINPLTFIVYFISPSVVPYQDKDTLNGYSTHWATLCGFRKNWDNPSIIALLGQVVLLSYDEIYVAFVSWTLWVSKCDQGSQGLIAGFELDNKYSNWFKTSVR